MKRGESVDVAHAGQLIMRKILCAIVLTSLLPLLVVVYLVHQYVLPSLGHWDETQSSVVNLMVFSTLVTVTSGGYVIWDLGRAVVTIAELMALRPAYAGARRRRDEVGAVTQWLATKRDLMERQTEQLQHLRSRLASVDEELALAKERFEALPAVENPDGASHLAWDTTGAVAESGDRSLSGI